jgi:hypothetical protein
MTTQSETHLVEILVPDVGASNGGEYVRSVMLSILAGLLVVVLM